MHSYAVVLGEMKGTRRIPIVIGGFEAQAIALALENLQPKRPLTHDLMTIMLETFEVELTEVLIYRIEEGIFYAKLICNYQDNVYEIDCRTSDAISLAIRTASPIYAYEEILDAASIEIDDDPDASKLSDENNPENKELQQDVAPAQNELSGLSLEELEVLLEEVLEQEDYAKAIKIRDEINKRKK